MICNPSWVMYYSSVKDFETDFKAKWEGEGWYKWQGKWALATNVQRDRVFVACYYDGDPRESCKKLLELPVRNQV